MMEGINFLGKHSYTNYGLTMAPGKSIGMPSKEKMTVKVPFNNSEYDFSLLYGSQPYSMRELNYPFNIFATGVNSKQRMNTEKTKIVNWLANSQGKQKLLDDAFPNYYFLAEVEDSTDFSENYNSGILKVTFKAYPFMIAELEEGNDVWDTFNFELDVAQDVSHTISGSKVVKLINAGTPDVFPTIEASSDMTIGLNGKTYLVKTGTTLNAEIPLTNGENNLTVTGNGTINFTFYKELI